MVHPLYRILYKVCFLNAFFFNIIINSYIINLSVKK